jgi:hypothetical protein
VDWREITMNSFFYETPEDNFKAEMISVEYLIFLNFVNIRTFWATGIQNEGASSPSPPP